LCKNNLKEIFGREFCCFGGYYQPAIADNQLAGTHGVAGIHRHLGDGLQTVLF
jgi:hypothetical protein